MLDQIAKLRPTSVLDIGPGLGKWGFLTRDLLDWNEGHVAPESWKVRLDAVEAFPLQTPVVEWVYDDVRKADILDVQDEIAGYDLVIMSDVIEHIEKTDALELVRGLLARNRNVLISTPVEFFEQDDPDNPYERHLSHWTVEDFTEFTYDLDIGGGASLVVLLAGAGATHPTTADQKVNDLLNRVPMLRRRGALRKLLKAPLAKRWPS